MAEKLSLLTKKLVEHKHVKQDVAEKLQQECSKNGKNIITELVKRDITTARIIANIAATEYGMPFFNLEYINVEYIPKLNVKDNGVFEKFHVAPIFMRGNKVFIGMSDPANAQHLDDLKLHIGMDFSLEAIVVEEDKLHNVISQFSGGHNFSDLEESLDDLEIIGEVADEDLDEVTEDDTPIVRFVHKVLLDAINSGASDIHFEHFEYMYRIRFRQDGILTEYTQPPVTHAAKITSRIKVMADLDISERRIPQDGRFKLRISKTRAIDFRISTCPTLFGEKVVMRILDPTSAQLGIDALGYEKFQKKAFLDAIERPQGMVLVTGPTGSGKTVSLYTALNILNKVEKNISTAEDPVEINLPGINQVNINNKAGLDFASALKSFLRQDPDIIMIGEIRDLETAEISVKAAQTGHLLLSTLHTNSAPETLVRLMNMGIPSYNLATSVILIIAQRLARRLCDKCKEKNDVPLDAKIEMGFTEEEAKDLTLYRAVGCMHCKAGYKGRVGLYEVMPITKNMRKVIMEGGTAIELAQEAEKEGIWTIRKSGLNKVKNGVTTFDEIYRVS